MDLKHNIRNVSVIAHVDHGKSTLTDSLVAAASIHAQEVAGDVGMTDTHADEAEHSITIKSTGISLCYKMTDESLKSLMGDRMGNKFLLHMIDLPGQVNFSSEVTASLQITDGALVVVDCIDGVHTHTDTILRQALGERIRPILTLSKIDRCFLELQVDGEEAYQTFQRVIANANVIIATYEDPLLGDVQVYPEKGTVAFSSGLYGWAFTLTVFAKMYSSKFRIDESKMLERLWGENYFDPSTKKWTSMNTGSPTCKRGFVQFCFEPIKQIINTCMNNQKEKLWPMLQKVGVTMKEEDKELLGKALMERVMQTWLPATSLLEMMIFHLPSPSTAQRYRVENLYEGPLDDQFADAIRNCNPKGPLMLYVSKMIPASDKGEFFAFGRVFAGKVSTGMKVRIMGPNYVHGQKNDLYITSVQRIFIWMGKRQESVENVPCGNTVIMVGLDQFITKNATLTNENDEDAFTIRSIKFSELPVVRVALKCKIASDRPKLVEGLKHLSELVPPLVVYYVGESGEHIVAGPGERHLEIWLRKLIDDFMGGIEVIQSPPMAVFCETVVGRSCPPAISYTPNKHNELHMEACPLAKDLVEAIEAGRIGPWDDPKVRSQMLSREFGWDRDAAKKIWCFGPANTGPNLVVEMAIDSQQGVKESVITAFLEASHEGGLCGEQMRGICFEVQYGKVDPQTINRKTCEVSPTASKIIYAAQLSAQPRLVEPIYLLHFLVPNAVIGVIFDILKRRHGHVIKQTYDPYTKLHKLGVLLAVKDSFGMEKTIGTATSGSVVLEYCAFDHWELICSDPLEFGSHASNLVMEIRKWKGI